MKKQNPNTKAMRKERNATRLNNILKRIQDDAAFNSMMRHDFNLSAFPKISLEKEQSFFDKIKSFFGSLK